MEHKKQKGLSIIALVFSVLPLATFIPILLKVTMSDGVRAIWGSTNVACVLLGLVFSVACVKSSDRRSIISIASMAISVLRLLLIVGMLALALVLSIMQ